MSSEKNLNSISYLNLNEGNSKTSSNNSKKSQSVEFNSSLSENDFNEKEALKTIENMKKESQNFSKDSNNPYDLDEKINYNYIKTILDSKTINNQQKINTFNDIQYKLAYKDRKSLLNDYKDLFATDILINEKNEIVYRQDQELKKVFISLLNDIMNEKSTNIKKKFETKYYVKPQSLKIPFLYGSEEYIFANLINDTYETFITKSKFPQKSKDSIFDESKDLSNYINNEATKPIITPIKVTEIDDGIKCMEVEEDINENNKKTYLNHSKYIDKKTLLTPIFKLYCSEEFQNKYKENLMKYSDRRVKYIYEIIIETLYYYSLYFNEEGKDDIISEFSGVFYEPQINKINALKDYEFDLSQIQDLKGKNVNISKEIENKIYKIKIFDSEYYLNFYDYNIKKLFKALLRLNDIQTDNKKQYVEKILNDPYYWTIQKFAKVNSLYNDNELNKYFKEEVDIMLKHKVLENLFNEISIFQNYQYPFLNEEFLDQVHNSIMYVKLPTKLIMGLTIKNMGIIVINKGRFEKIINEQKNKNTLFALRLSEFSFYKITLFHEINFHYFLVILFSNKKIYLTTPEIVFKNYIINKKAKCDFGDKGEVILFGKKVSELYINGIVNIITLDNWNKNVGKKSIDIGKNFLNLNKEKKDTGEFSLNNLKGLSNFCKRLYEVVNNEINFVDFNLNSDIGDFFSRGKIFKMNVDESNIEGKNFSTIISRGICLNAGRYNM